MTFCPPSGVTRFIRSGTLARSSDLALMQPYTVATWMAVIGETETPVELGKPPSAQKSEGVGEARLPPSLVTDGARYGSRASAAILGGGIRTAKTTWSG